MSISAWCRTKLELKKNLPAILMMDVFEQSDSELTCWLEPKELECVKLSLILTV